MADVKKAKVTFKVVANGNVDALYVCGNVAELGGWDASKSVKLEYNEAEGAYVASKMLPVDAEVEYKVLACKDWAGVECHYDYSEVENHYFVVAKGHVESISVEAFK